MPDSPLCASSRARSWRVASAFRPHRQKQVRAVERTHEDPWSAARTAARRSRPARRVRGRGHRNRLDAIERVRDLAQAQIFGAEIAAPLRDAMGFVNGETVDLRPAQGGDRVVAQKPLGSDIEQPQRTLVEAARDPAAFIGVGGGIEARRLDACLAQSGRPDRASARSAAKPRA